MVTWLMDLLLDRLSLILLHPQMDPDLFGQVKIPYRTKFDSLTLLMYCSVYFFSFPSSSIYFPSVKITPSSSHITRPSLHITPSSWLIVLDLQLSRPNQTWPTHLTYHLIYLPDMPTCWSTYLTYLPWKYICLPFRLFKLGQFCNSCDFLKMWVQFLIRF